MKKNLRIWGICCILLVLLLSAHFTYAAKKSSQDNIEVAQKLLKIKKSRKKGIKRLAILAKLAKKDDFASIYIGHQAILILAKEYRSPSNIFIPAKGKLPKYNTDAILQKNTSLTKALKLVKDYNDFSIIRDWTPSQPDKEYCNPKLLPFLELSHCKAINLEVNESFKMVNYAETNTKGLDKCRTLFKFAEILYDVGKATDSIDNLERAKRYLSDCLQYGNDFFQPLKISETGKTKNNSGYAEWQSIKKQIPGFELEIDFALLAKELGPGYADLVRMKTHFADKDWFLAYPLAEKIMIKYSGTIYSTEARLYRCRMLLMNDTAGEYRDKDVPSGVNEMKKFIEDRPYGNLRGEALLDLANHYLICKWDAKQASLYYNKALNWFRKVREHDDAVDLLALPAKVKTISTPTEEITFFNKWHQTQYRKPGPKEIINRKTAPWYMNEYEKECLFMVGFCLLQEGQFKEAEEYFSQVSSIDKDIAFLEQKNFPNALMRLKSCCKTGYIVLPPNSRKLLSRKNRLKTFFAAFKYILEDFNTAEKIYQEILDNPKSKPVDLASAYMGIGNCHDMITEKQDSAELFTKAYEISPKTVIGAESLYRLACNLQGNGEFDKSIKTFKKYLKEFPKGTRLQNSLFNISEIYGSLEKISLSKKYAFKFIEKYGSTAFRVGNLAKLICILTNDDYITGTKC